MNAAGDVNGDGYADVAVGAERYSNGQAWEGGAFVYYGREDISGLVAANDSPTVLGHATTLTATVAAGSNITYTWAFGDGGLGSGAVVSHTYPAVGVYTAVVTASNSVSSLTATTTVSITPRTCWARLNDDPTDYLDVQSAVDASSQPDDVVKVAGYCTGVQGRPAPPGYSGPAVITQVVYISKTLTLRGGYTTTNWLTPDPEAYPTTLDAQRLGRVLYITGHISPTIEGLRLTGGDATGQRGGFESWHDAGGGAYIHTAMATISNCTFYSNTANSRESGYVQGYGGGLYLADSQSLVTGNRAARQHSQHGWAGFRRRIGTCWLRCHAE